MIEKLNDNYYDSEMLINEIVNSSLDLDIFNEKYEIYTLKYIGNDIWIDFNAKFFDRLDNEKIVEAVNFMGGKKTVNILMKKGNKININNILSQEEQKDYKIEPFFVEELDKQLCVDKMDVVYGLLFNNLPKCQENNKNFSNTKGQLYLYIPVNRKKIAEGQYIAMNIKVKNGLVLREQVSFFEFDENNKMHKNRAKYSLEEGPKNTILIKAYEGKGVAYIRRGNINKKVLIPIDNLIMNNDDYTKMQMYNELSDAFNYVYKDFVKLEYRKVPIKRMLIENYEKVKNKKKEEIKKLENVYYVKLETPNDEESKNEKVFEKELLELYPKLKYRDNIVEDALNIVLIRDKDYYEANNLRDIKLDLPKNEVIQCATLDTIKSKRIDAFNPYVLHIYNELFVKSELHKHFIERWNSGEMEFYIGIKKKIEKEYEEFHCLMHIFEDGTFKITSDIDEIDKDSYRKYLNDFKFSGEVCIVKKGDNYNRIYHTDYMPMFDVEKVKELIEYSKATNNKVTRKKDKKSKLNGLLYPYLGKSIMEIDGKLHYCVGKDNVIYKQMQMCNIYRVDPVGKSEVIYEIFDLLDDIHVRGNSAGSVRPYPFKYIMEYIRINNPGIWFTLK